MNIDYKMRKGIIGISKDDDKLNFVITFKMEVEKPKIKYNIPQELLVGSFNLN